MLTKEEVLNFALLCIYRTNIIKHELHSPTGCLHRSISYRMPGQSGAFITGDE